MLDCSILEKITLNFLGDIPYESINNKERYILSIMNNIQRILNTRRGSMKNVPDYGLPDLSIIYKHLPSSLDLLQKHIIYTLLKYEPRLRSIRIQNKRDTSTQFIIIYELFCDINNHGIMRLSTIFNSDESVSVCR